MDLLERVTKWVEDKGLAKSFLKKYTIVSFGPRSAIERLFGDIEWRIRRFWNGFTGERSNKCVKLKVSVPIKATILNHNNIIRCSSR